MIRLIMMILLYFMLAFGKGGSLSYFISQYLTGGTAAEAQPETTVDMQGSLGDFAPLDIVDEGIEITFNDENLASAGG